MRPFVAPTRMMVIGISLTGATAAGVLATVGPATQYRPIIIASSAMALLCVCLLGALEMRLHPLGVLSPAVLMALALWIWHFGMVTQFALGLDVAFPWYYLYDPEFVVPAIALCGAGIAAFCAGAAARAPSAEALPRVEEKPQDIVFKTFVLVILAVGFLSVFGTLYQIGLRRFVSTPYAVRLRAFEATFGESRFFDIGMVITSVGLPWLFLVSWSRRWIPWTFVAAYFAAVSWLGYRTAALPPVVGSLILWRLRGLRVHWGNGALVGLLLLVVLPAVSIIRENPTDPVGAFNQYQKQAGSGGVLVLEEMGRSVTTVVRTMSQVRAENQFGGGRSFVLGLLQGLPNPLPMEITKRTRFERRDYWISRTTNAQYFRDENLTIGYSVIAEFYYNFGLVGTIVGMLAFGFATSWGTAELMAWHSPWRVGAVVSAATVMFIGVRNDSVFYSRRIGWALLLLLGMFLAQRLVWGALRGRVMGGTSGEGDAIARG